MIFFWSYAVVYKKNSKSTTISASNGQKKTGLTLLIWAWSILKSSMKQQEKWSSQPTIVINKDKLINIISILFYFYLMIVLYNNIHTITHKLYSSKFIRYMLWGVTAAVIDLLFLSFFTEFLWLYYLFSQICSFCIAFCYSFWFQKRITFRDNSDNHLLQGAKFLLFQLIWLWINLVILHYIVQTRWGHYLMWSILAKGVVFFRNFSMNKWFNFS